MTRRPLEPVTEDIGSIPKMASYVLTIRLDRWVKEQANLRNQSQAEFMRNLIDRAMQSDESVDDRQAA